MLMRCVDEYGLEGVLTEGQVYRVQRLPCGAARLSSGLVCCLSRFRRIANG